MIIKSLELENIRSYKKIKPLSSMLVTAEDLPENIEII